MFAAEQRRPDVHSRRTWWDILVRGRYRPSQLVFLDETAISTHMIRRHGRSPKGERVVAFETLGGWQTNTLLAAIRTSGWSVAMVVKGASDADAFVTYIAHFLVPTLREDNVVILDNASSHHDDRIRPFVQATGAKLIYRPPYSPDFNPIENAFSQLKAGLKRLSERTFEGLTTAVGQLLDAATAEQCAHFFAACGYGRG